VDNNPDFYTGHNDAHGLKLTFVQAGHCYNNELPCRDYTRENILGCTVCSKLWACLCYYILLYYILLYYILLHYIFLYYILLYYILLYYSIIHIILLYSV